MLSTHQTAQQTVKLLRRRCFCVAKTSDLGPVVHLNSNPKVVLVGVNHISRGSIHAVRDAIRELQPEYVAVELDRERAKMLLKPTQRGDSILGSEEYSNPTTDWELHFVDQFQSLFSHWFMVKGKELVTAIAEAKECGSKVWLVDRPSWVTAQRLEALRLKYNTEPADKMWRQVYVNERDQWMVGQLQARIGLRGPGEERGDAGCCVVCVVGRAHIPGMKALWESGAVIDDERMEELMFTNEGQPMPWHTQEYRNNSMIQRHAIVALAFVGFFGFHVPWHVVWQVVIG